MKKDFPWWAIVLGFMFFWPAGVGMLIYNLSNNGKKVNRTYHPPGTYVSYNQPQSSATYVAPAQRPYTPLNPNNLSSYGKTYQRPTVQPANHPYNQGQPGFQPPHYTPQQPHQQYNAHAAYNRNDPMRHIANDSKKSFVFGAVLLGLGAFASVAALIGAFSSGEIWYNFFGALAMSASPMIIMGIPGAILATTNINARARNERCRSYMSMVGEHKNIDISDIAEANRQPTSRVIKDLRWMLGKGFFPGAYIDMRSMSLVYSGHEKAPKPVVEQPVQNNDGTYPEARKIRELNEIIADPFVSERMDRLEILTHNIFAYVEANPDKTPKLRQFKNHYLPKTIKILESYARFERQKIEGENIRSAMKDVEAIMDKLVTGFEKQLDMLFDNEALDVSSDISVLESMMGIEGLSAMDPFNASKSKPSDDEIKLI